MIFPILFGISKYISSIIMDTLQMTTVINQKYLETIAIIIF